MAPRHLLTACVAAVGVLVLLTGLAGAAQGDLDETFGVGGRVLVPLGVYDAQSRASIVQPDGKIVLVGSGPHAEVGNEDFFVVRLNEDGSLDQSFGSGGIVRTPIDLDPGARDVARDVALGPGGAIVVVGEATEPQSTGDSDLAFVRYTSSGALDSSFSDDGIQTVDLGWLDIGYGLAVQPSDGKIVAVGTEGANVGFETLRLQLDGSLDDSFGSGGVARTNVGDDSVRDYSQDVVLAGGAIVVSGIADSSNGGDFGLVRYLSDGTLDPSFGSGGIVVTPGPDAESIWATAILPGGRILAGGSARNFQTGDKFQVARYLASGALDPSFGGTGVVVTPIGTNSGVSALSLQSDGKAVAGGSAWSGGPRFALTRYNDNGSLDGSFGDGGTRVYPVGQLGGHGWSIGIQHLTDGRERLIQGGTALEAAGGTFAAIGIRLDGPPAPPPPPPFPPPPPPVPPPPPPAQRICIVPSVVGQTLRRARTRIRSRGCAVGRIRHARSRRAGGLVIVQKPKAGLRKPRGTRVSLVISRGRR